MELINFDFDRLRPVLAQSLRLTVEDLGPHFGPAFNETADSIRPRLSLQKTERGLVMTWPSAQRLYKIQVSDTSTGPWQSLSTLYGFDKTNPVLDLGFRPGTKFFRLITATP